MPLAVAVDLLGVLLLTRLVRLELAALIARGIWLAGGVALGARATSALRGLHGPGPHASRHRHRRRRRDSRHPPQHALLAALRDLGPRLAHPARGFASWPKAAFANVYDSEMVLHYHFAGDVFASLVQVFSGCVLHSSLALSVAHDVLFGETAASLALLFVHLGVKGTVGPMAAVVAVLLDGPATVLLDDASHLRRRDTRQSTISS